MPLHSDSASGIFSSYLAPIVFSLLFMVGVQWDLLVVFVEWSQFVRKLWGMCANPLPDSLTCFFQAEIVGCNMKTNETQLWKTCVLLLSRGSSPLRAPLLGLWNVLRLKTSSLWDLEHGTAAVLSPCSCKNWPKQAEQTLFAFFYGPAEGRAALPSGEGLQLYQQRHL